MRIKILPEPVIERLRNHPTAYRLARRARFALGGVMKPMVVDGIPGRVHPNDFMLVNTSPDGVAEYKRGAATVLALLERSLSAAGRPWNSIDRWLDFGCGYGRVTRHLVERVPKERVWVTDLLPEAIAFCANEFGVHPVPNLAADRSLDGTFDLIYAISVFTHISSNDADGLTSMLTRALAPGGLLVCTTHGQGSVDVLDSYGAYMASHREEIVKGLATTGYHYVPYSHSGDGSYGMAWTDPAGVERRFAEHAAHPVEQVHYEPAGLDGHQDVFVYRRRP